jgi:hypothetical protein
MSLIMPDLTWREVCVGDVIGVTTDMSGLVTSVAPVEMTQLMRAF